MNILLFIVLIPLIGFCYVESKTLPDKIRLALIPILILASLNLIWFIGSCWALRNYMALTSSIWILALPPTLYCSAALVIISICAWTKGGYRNLNGFKNFKGLGDECSNGAVKALSEGLIYGMLYGIIAGLSIGLCKGFFNIHAFQESMIEGLYLGLVVILLWNFFIVGVYGTYANE